MDPTVVVDRNIILGVASLELRSLKRPRDDIHSYTQKQYLIRNGKGWL